VKKQEFDEIFDEIVSDALTNRGFVQRGKSLFLEDGNTHVAWIRGGGRFVVPDSIAHLVCFRHAFLRDKEGHIPAAAPGFAENYPWLLNAELLPTSIPKDWDFAPSRLMSLPFGRYDYADLSQSVVRNDLTKRRNGFLRYVDWASGVGVDEAEAQMIPFAEEYWIARLWLDDYSGIKFSRLPA
jgi:hypothetical protein